MGRQSGYTLTDLLIVLWAGVCVCLIAAPIWVAFHFIAKFW